MVKVTYLRTSNIVEISTHSDVALLRMSLLLRETCGWLADTSIRIVTEPEAWNLLVQYVSCTSNISCLRNQLR
jgi:hypothetical protein